MPDQRPVIAIIIVCYNSSKVIQNCVRSLLESECSSEFLTVIVDNDSGDDTVQKIGELGRIKGISIQIQAVKDEPCDCLLGSVYVLRSRVNGGYAYAVNRGIEFAAQFPSVKAYWILNPDTVVPPTTPGALIAFARSTVFGMAGGRCLFHDSPEIIQTDGGVHDRLTGTCRSLNAHRDRRSTPPPSSQSLDFISGANLMVSRAFVDDVGLMNESYFLYYEEVDWAARRGTYKLHLVDGAEVYHVGGTSIGSASIGRGPSPLSLYFIHRNRMWFQRKFSANYVPVALAWSVVKAIQVFLKMSWRHAWAVFAGAFDLAPPRYVASRYSDPAVLRRAFPGYTKGDRQKQW